MAPSPVKPRIRVMAVMAPSPETHEPPAPNPEPVIAPIPEDDDAPFDPPDEIDLAAMGAWESEDDEEAGFTPVPDMEIWDDEPISDWPADAYANTDAVAAAQPPKAAAPEISEAGRRFEQDALSLIAAHACATAPSDPAPEPPDPPPPPRSTHPIYDQPVPPIVIHGSWDRTEIGALLADFAADSRMARAAVTTDRGGLDAAIARFTHQSAPDLLILDSTLRARELLAGIDKLIALIGDKSKIFIVGAVNDIALLRELGARGVKYVVPPLGDEDLARAVCGLYAQIDASRVIAVMGARGGVGASTIAHNLAWSIAERCGGDTTLIDLDLAFGALAFNAQRPAPYTLADITRAGARDIGAIERAAVHHTPRLQILAAPTDLEPAFELDPAALEALLTRARRASSFVVLDLPHAWNSWVRHALLRADDVLIVAGPDLASLRNADNILKLVQRERPSAEPLVVLSMSGVPKRPEIPAKDFTQALGAAPAASLPYDPALYGAAALAGQMLAEIAPRAKAAQTIEQLASTLTGLALLKGKKKVQTLRAAEHAIDDAAQRAGAHEPDAEEASREEAPPLERAPLEADYLAKARAATETRTRAAARDEETERRPRTRPLRVAAFVLALVMLGAVWRTQSASEAATPQPPAAEAATPIADASEQTRRAWSLMQDHASQAVAMLRPLGESGYAPAQYLLAKAYQRGQGVAADLALARQWTERAARGGHARAMHDLGVYYASGEGAPRDDDAAFRWFRQAAEFNVADSQFNLGILYQEGRGVGKNDTEALFWFLAAARQNDEAAAQRAAALEARLNPEQVAQTHARADGFRARTQAGRARE